MGPVGGIIYCHITMKPQVDSVIIHAYLITYICMYAYVYVHTYMHTCVCLHTYKHACVCLAL